MQIDEASSFEEFQGEKPKKKFDPAGKSKFRFALITLTILIGLIAIIALLKNTNTLDVIKGTGTIVGTVVDENGKPFQGDIFILGTNLTAKTDQSGHFEIGGVPAGQQSLVVADAFIGHEFTVQVNSASQLQMGEIHFQSTAVAPPP